MYLFIKKLLWKKGKISKEVSNYPITLILSFLMLGNLSAYIIEPFTEQNWWEINKYTGVKHGSGYVRITLVKFTQFYKVGAIPQNKVIEIRYQEIPHTLLIYL